jgi:glycosyltransferase involved in cell wall biosynthesis
VVEAFRGGTSAYLVDLVRHTPHVEHHVAIPPPGREAAGSGAARDGRAEQALVELGAAVHLVDMRRSPAHPANAGAALALRRLIRALRPTAVHCHSAIGGALGRVAAAGTGVPALYMPHALPEGRPALLAERALGRLTWRLVAISDSEARQAAILGAVPAAKVEVVRNGVDLDAAVAAVDVRGRAGVPEGAPLVGTAIRLVPQKAPLLFVAVCEHVARLRPDAHFLLAGGGPLQPQLDAAVRASGLGDRWHQLPSVDPASVAGQLDVFVLATAFEGGPYAPLVAMRDGTPVVLTDVVGNRDVVEHGRSGLLAPYGDPEAIARQVVSVLDDPDLAAALSAGGRRRVGETFDARRMGEAMERLYGDAARLGKKGKSPLKGRRAG